MLLRRFQCLGEKHRQVHPKEPVRW